MENNVQGLERQGNYLVENSHFSSISVFSRISLIIIYGKLTTLNNFLF